MDKTTDYRISTITAVGNIGSVIDLQQFFDIFNPTNNIVYVEYGKTKNILREILNKHIPNHLFERPKMGFGIPIHDWIRSDLKDWASQMLFDCPDSDQYLPTDLIRKKWDDHQAEKNNNFFELWSVIQLNQWMANKN